MSSRKDPPWPLLWSRAPPLPAPSSFPPYRPPGARGHVDDLQLEVQGHAGEALGDVLAQQLLADKVGPGGVGGRQRAARVGPEHGRGRRVPAPGQLPVKSCRAPAHWANEAAPRRCILFVSVMGGRPRRPRPCVSAGPNPGGGGREKGRQRSGGAPYRDRGRAPGADAQRSRCGNADGRAGVEVTVRVVSFSRLGFRLSPLCDSRSASLCEGACGAANGGRQRGRFPPLEFQEGGE